MVPREEGSSSSELSRLDEEMQQIQGDKQEAERKIKQLRSEEDVRRGIVYAGRIHELQQEKLRLEVELQRLENKKKALLWEEGLS